MATSDAATTRDVLNLGERWTEAELRGSADLLAPLLAADFRLVGPLGFVLTKEQYLASRSSRDLQHQSLTWDEVEVRAYRDTAIAIGTQAQVSTYQGRDASGRFRVTQILVREQDGWLIAGIHLSPIAQPPEGTRS